MLLAWCVAPAQNREVASVPSAKAASAAEVAALRMRVEILEAELALIRPDSDAPNNDELVRRVEALERTLRSTQPAAAIPAGKAQWRKIRRGLSAAQVRSLLGEPTNIRTVASWEHWTYPRGGTVELHYKTGVSGWQEPSG